VKDGMETDIAKTKLVRSDFELCLAVFADQRARIVRSHRKIKEAVNRAGRLGKIRNNHALGWLLRLSGGRRQCGGNCEKKSSLKRNQADF
jgi:hypothetical protein